MAVADVDPPGGRTRGRRFPLRCLARGLGEVLRARGAARFGRLDALINNAGLADPADPPVENFPAGVEPADRREPHRRVPDDQALHAASSPHRGAIVNIASTRALQSEPNTEAYAATKGGVVALTHALAMSLGPRVRVNRISPGWIAKSKLSRKDHAQTRSAAPGGPRTSAS